jgi:hypothetical protein
MGLTTTDRRTIHLVRRGRRALPRDIRRLAKKQARAGCPPGWHKVSVKGFPGVYVCVPNAEGDPDLSSTYDPFGP